MSLASDYTSNFETPARSQRNTLVADSVLRRVALREQTEQAIRIVSRLERRTCPLRSGIWRPRHRSWAAHRSSLSAAPIRIGEEGST